MACPPDRHIPYFHVLDAFRAARGCALCELELASIRRYFKDLLYESVNDPKVRSNLLSSKGYCRVHARVLASFRDGLGTAILYQDQVRLFLSFLDELEQRAPRRIPKAAAGWRPEQRCPACRIQLQSRERHVSIFVKGLVYEEMVSALKESPGLCVPHFLAAVKAAANTPCRQPLIAIERQKFEELLGDLEEFCRKHDYRYSDEPFGKQGDSWLRALRMLAGEAGIL